MRSDYAAALVDHFGDRAITIARAQADNATGEALAEWTALADLLAARGPAEAEPGVTAAKGDAVRSETGCPQ